MAARRPFTDLYSSESDSHSPDLEAAEGTTSLASAARQFPHYQEQGSRHSTKRRRTSAYNASRESSVPAFTVTPDGMRQENGNISSEPPMPNTIGGLSSMNGFSRNGFSKTNGNGTDPSARNGSGKLEGDSAASSFTMMAPPAPTSDYFGHNREEVTRILIQSLYDLGYQAAAEQLERDSEYTLEAPEVSRFRQAVLNGNWNKAEKLLFRLDIVKDADVNVSITSHDNDICAYNSIW